MTSGVVDYYRVLGVTPAASGAEIRAAFLDLAKKLHPDRAPEPDRPLAEQRFRELSAAYEVLSDPSRRADYDVRRQLTRVWARPERRRGYWRVPEHVAQRWGFERLPWYGWLLVGPALLTLGLAVVVQFFFYYTFIYGIVVLVPIACGYYMWLVWPPLAVALAFPTVWGWGFLIQGTYRNWRSERIIAAAKFARERDGG